MIHPSHSVTPAIPPSYTADPCPYCTTPVDHPDIEKPCPGLVIDLNGWQVEGPGVPKQIIKEGTLTITKGPV